MTPLRHQEAKSLLLTGEKSTELVAWSIIHVAVDGTMQFLILGPFPQCGLWNDLEDLLLHGWECFYLLCPSLCSSSRGRSVFCLELIWGPSVSIDVCFQGRARFADESSCCFSLGSKFNSPRWTFFFPLGFHFIFSRNPQINSWKQRYCLFWY